MKRQSDFAMSNGFINPIYNDNSSGMTKNIAQFFQAWSQSVYQSLPEDHLVIKGRF